MAWEVPGVLISMKQGSTNLAQYRIVRCSAANTVVHTTGLSTGTAAVVSLGVTQNAPTASTVFKTQAITVMISGVTKVEASTGAIPAGAFVRATSGSAATVGGKAKASSNSTPRHVGIALTSAAAGAGVRIISMRLL